MPEAKMLGEKISETQAPHIRGYSTLTEMPCAEQRSLGKYIAIFYVLEKEWHGHRCKPASSNIVAA